MGIHFLNDTVPAVALGACDVSLLDFGKFILYSH